MFKILGADGKEYGPVTPGTVHEWIAGGRANLQTKARLYNETEWKTLGDFPEFGEFGTTGGAGGPTPPPLSATTPQFTGPFRSPRGGDRTRQPLAAPARRDDRRPAQGHLLFADHHSDHARPARFRRPRADNPPSPKSAGSPTRS